MRRFLLAVAAILAVIFFASVQVRGEDREFELVKMNQRSLSKELGERPCGPYFIGLDFGHKELYISFNYKEENQLRSNAVPKLRSAVKIDNGKANPLVRLGTDEEKRETALFVLNDEDYKTAKTAEGCLPEPQK